MRLWSNVRNKPIKLFFRVTAIVLGLLTSCVPPQPPQQTGGPQFIINSPVDGTKIASPVFFSVQPLNSNEVKSVTFMAGETELKNDAPYEDAFKVFLLPSDFPTGKLTLSATATGTNGKISNQKITVNLINPADLNETATVQNDGAIVGTKEDNGAVSVFTLPAGTPTGTSVSFVSKTKQEVKAATGVDYDALGVTFLGAQEIKSSKPVTGGMVASGGYGPMVQNGQAVVNYMIMPDGDGDGIGELVVVNGASVAPNGDIISNPERLPRFIDVDKSTLKTAANATGRPGSIFSISVTGFRKNKIYPVYFQADGKNTRTPGLISYSSKTFNSYDLQVLEFMVPSVEPGMYELKIGTSRESELSFEFEVQQLQKKSTLDASMTIESVLNNLVESWKSQPLASIDGANDYITILEGVINSFNEIRDNPDAVPFIQAFGAILENYRLSSSNIQTIYTQQNDDFNKELRDLDKIKNDSFEAGRALNEGNREFQEKYPPGIPDGGMSNGLSLGSIFGSFLGIKAHQKQEQMIYCKYYNICPPKPEPVDPNGGNGNNNTTGMGAAPPPGGSGDGNIPDFDEPSNKTIKASQFASNGQFIVKVFSSGKSGPFTGMTDIDGYFYIPFIAADQPFVAVATKVSTGETRTFEGIGPKTGDSVFINFNFLSDVTSDLTVTTLANSGPGSLRQVIADAKNGNRIGFDVTGTITLSSEIVINKLLFLDGPGSDKVTISGGNTTRLFNIQPAIALNISNLTLANGRGDNGGAIYNDGELNLSKVTLTNNTATISGGAIYNAEGDSQPPNTLNVINSSITNNTAVVHGGGIYSFGIDGLGEIGFVQTSISNSIIADNTAQTGSGGGVVVGQYDFIEITKSQFLRNEAAVNGGGLYVAQADFIISDSGFSANVAGDTAGAIFHSGGGSITNTSILDNRAGYSGGIGEGFAGKIVIKNSTIAGNISEGSVGGLSVFELVLINSTVANNQAADNAGGISTSLATLNNSTITGNTAGGEAGGVDVFVSGSLVSKNSIITGNSALAYPDAIVRGYLGEFTSLGHNIVGSSEGNGFVDGVNGDFVGVDAKLLSLTDNGGPTQTIGLGSGSPAINAIPIAECKDAEGNTITTDQRGITRPQGAACDIGAFETN